MSACNTRLCAYLPGENVETLPFTRKCRYHKRQGQVFSRGQLLPAGMCAHLYRMAYPYCLSLLYDAAYDDGAGNKTRALCIRCPADSVTASVTVRYLMPAWLRRLKRGAIRLLHRAGIGGEFPDKRVVIRVMRVEGECPAGMREQDAFFLNIRKRDELCPASFYALYPAILAPLMQGARRRDNRAAGSAVFECPDADGVRYRIKGLTPLRCEDYFSVEAGVTESQPGCPAGLREQERISYDRVSCSSLCPLAYYAAFPYHLTLSHGGILEWVKPHEAVRVNCPRHGGIVMEIALTRPKDSIRVTVAAVKDSCPKGHAAGDTFIFGASEWDQRLDILTALIPFAAGRDHPQVYAYQAAAGDCRMKLRIDRE
ncbi:MAG: TIGR04076 family protein [Candidatus Omnitrophica bacterium]|nr:TIGR04076 family protein [Candidatus Omnitrophota bacterium]